MPEHIYAFIPSWHELKIPSLYIRTSSRTPHYCGIEELLSVITANTFRTVTGLFFQNQSLHSSCFHFRLSPTGPSGPSSSQMSVRQFSGILHAHYAITIHVCQMAVNFEWGDIFRPYKLHASFTTAHRQNKPHITLPRHVMPISNKPRITAHRDGISMQAM